MTNIWELSDAQRRKDFIRQWRADLAGKLQPVASGKELREMNCRECANEEYAMVVEANLAHAESLAEQFRLTPPSPLSAYADTQMKEEMTNG